MPPKGNEPVDVKKPVNYEALKDRNVLVTGGASGLGKGFVHMFAEHGANVVIADLQDGPGKQLEQELAGKNGKYVYCLCLSKLVINNTQESNTSTLM